MQRQSVFRKDIGSHDTDSLESGRLLRWSSMASRAHRPYSRPTWHSTVVQQQIHDLLSRYSREIDPLNLASVVEYRPAVDVNVVDVSPRIYQEREKVQRG